jgi:hypothetical protein
VLSPCLSRFLGSLMRKPFCKVEVKRRSAEKGRESKRHGDIRPRRSAGPAQSRGARCHRLVCRICVALFAHGHLPRALAAHWLGLPAGSGHHCSRRSPITALASLARIFRCQNCFIHGIQAAANDARRGGIGPPR